MPAEAVRAVATPVGTKTTRAARLRLGLGLQDVTPGKRRGITRASAAASKRVLTMLDDDEAAAGEAKPAAKAAKAAPAKAREEEVRTRGEPWPSTNVTA